MPYPNRPRPSQLHHHQTHGAEPDAQSARQGLPTPQAKGRRMGRRLPRQPHRSVICSPDCPAYDTARSEFRAIRAFVKERLGERDVSYITTGHSLGGGIAQHIAYGFPCVSAVVFDTFFVTNTYYYEQPYEPVIVHLHDLGRVDGFDEDEAE